MMPAKRLRLKCRYIFTLLGVLVLVPAGVEAQTGGVTIKSTVSETVSLSVLQNSIQSDVVTSVISNGNTVRITLSRPGTDAVIRVPLLVRSNSSFKIAAEVESQTAAVAQLSVVDVRATGTLVSPRALSELSVPPRLDIRGRAENSSPAPNLVDNSRPLFVASGPRVSLGGTLTSPNNALQITVLIRLKPAPAHDSSIQLTFVATAGSLIH